MSKIIRKKEIENTEREKGFGRHYSPSLYSLGSQKQQQQQPQK